MNLEKITDLEQLSGDQKELAEIIGLEAYKKLVSNYGGSHIYICKSDTILRDLRNKEIYDRFNGYDYRELAKEYNLSEKTVREIVSLNVNKQIDGQIGFF